MTITQLEYVLAVDRNRHFGKAAKECCVTQPTLSMQLQKLEDELGIIIFDRSKSPILPTIEGEAVITQAKIVIKENKKIYEVIELAKNNLSGHFKLAVIPTLAPYVIPLFAQKFSEKYPDINLIIEESKTEDIIKQLDSDEIDAGILVTPLHDNSLIERVLFYEPFYLFAREDHPMSKLKEVDQAKLDLDEIWLLNKGNCFRDQILNICSETRGEVKGNLRFESGNFETLKNMVLSCSGYTILPHLAVEQMTASRKKMVRPFKAPVPTREVSLVHSRSFMKEKIIEAIQDEIVAAAPKELRTLKGSVIEIF
ncbi:MAG: hydrogen peroxide-inducible genes activator [Bacteriovoracaceae bacterium]|nr:hydrogen peroxide-inducible genes activator [Bacteriovoracaceae bacterium]